jgi:hypothetical protein
LTLEGTRVTEHESEQIGRANATTSTPIKLESHAHAPTIDRNGAKVADTALAFVRRFAQP